MPDAPVLAPLSSSGHERWNEVLGLSASSASIRKLCLTASIHSNIGALHHYRGEMPAAFTHYQTSLSVRMEALRRQQGQRSTQQTAVAVANGEEDAKDTRRLNEARSVEAEMLRQEAHGSALVASSTQSKERQTTATDDNSDLTILEQAPQRYRPTPQQLHVELYRRGGRHAFIDEHEEDEDFDKKSDEQGSVPSLHQASATKHRTLPILVNHSLSSSLREPSSYCLDSAITLFNMALWHMTYSQSTNESSMEAALSLLQMGLSVCPLVPEAPINGAVQQCTEEARYHELVASGHIPSLCGQGPNQHQHQDNNNPAAEAFTSPSPPADFWEVLAFIHTTFGQIYFEGGQPDKALPHFSKALAASYHCQATPGSSQPHLAITVMSHLGHTHYRRGELRHAMSACRAMLHLLRPTASDAAEDVDAKQWAAARVLHNMGTLHYQCGQNSQALSQYDAFLSIHDNEDHLKARTLHHVGQIWAGEGEHRRSIQAFVESAALMYRLRGTENHRSLLPIMDSLGNAYLNAGMHDDALRIFRRTLGIVEQTLGEGSIEAVTQLCNIGQVYHMKGRVNEAVKCYIDAIDIVEGLVDGDGTDNSDNSDDGTASSLHTTRYLQGLQLEMLRTLGTAQLEMGDVPAASMTFREASELDACLQNSDQAQVSSGPRSQPRPGFDVGTIVFQGWHDNHPPAPAA